MSLSKDRKARRELAIKRARRNRILVILASIIAVAGISAAVVFLVDWDNIGDAHASHDHAPGMPC